MVSAATLTAISKWLGDHCIDPLHVRGNAINLEDRTIRFFFLHENRSQFPEEKIYFDLSSRLAAFLHYVQGVY